VKLHICVIPAVVSNLLVCWGYCMP
jgi:hypothetical protein